MNERIKELKDQCYICLIDRDDDNEYDMEKFAELIVRECLDIVNRKEYSYHEADPLWETAQLIKERFGAEE
jgi:hypothetical protein